MSEEDDLRERLHQEMIEVGKQADIDRSTYVSVKEIVDMLGPNLKSANTLHGLMTGLKMETITTNQSGIKNTWLTEEQAKLIIREVLSHPVRTHLGENEE